MKRLGSVMQVLQKAVSREYCQFPVHDSKTYLVLHCHFTCAWIDLLQYCVVLQREGQDTLNTFCNFVLVCGCSFVWKLIHWWFTATFETQVHFLTDVTHFSIRSKSSVKSRRHVKNNIKVNDEWMGERERTHQLRMGEEEKGKEQQHTS
jgi:hypothetical protein